jgi:hypothetical protein
MRGIPKRFGEETEGIVCKDVCECDKYVNVISM